MVALTLEMAVVFGVIVVAVVLFASEMLPPDITAIGILVTLALLEPVTGVGTVDAIAGFASPATITILAMYILSEGINQSGVVDRIGDGISRLTVGNPRRLLLATVGSTGISAGLMNNTPVVAVFIPMVTRLADRAGLSPSKLLLPLSYAAMLGGTLTLIGTATNLLASDLSRDLLDHPIGMFEFTPLGIVVLLVGIIYLLTLGNHLTPARVAPGRDLTVAYELENHLSRVRLREESAFVGQTVAELQSRIDEEEFPLDILRIERDGESHLAGRSQLVVEPGDVLL
ncbi:MAG: SLC13 family permease, partial [Natronomonas sp.]